MAIYIPEDMTAPQFRVRSSGGISKSINGETTEEMNGMAEIYICI